MTLDRPRALVHYPDICWPPGRCINPDECPVVYAAIMQTMYEGLDVSEALWIQWPEEGVVIRGVKEQRKPDWEPPTP